MVTAKYESDSSQTNLSITEFSNGDIVLTIDGNDEFRISSTGGKLTGVRLCKIKSLFAELICELNKGVITLNKKQFADMLNGRGRDHELSHEEQEIAKENGLVIVFGYSDDGMVFNGAITGQVDCWQGGVAYLDEKGLKKASTDENSGKSIRAIYSGARERLFDGKPYWSYETDIPHEKFLIYEDEIDNDDTCDRDDEIWCEGIIFDMNALQT